MSNFGFLGPIAPVGADTSDGAAQQHRLRPEPAHGGVLSPASTTNGLPSGDTRSNPVSALLEQHNRAWTRAFGQLEQHRAALSEVEEQVHALQAELDVLLPIVQQAEQDVQTALVRPGAFERASGMETLLGSGISAAEQLAGLAQTVAEHLARRRSAWEQYCTSLEEVRRVLTSPLT